MERLTIKAVSPESGRAMLAALSGFHAELLEAADGSEIVVTMDGDSEIVAVLNALERRRWNSMVIPTSCTRSRKPARRTLFGTRAS